MHTCILSQVICGMIALWHTTGTAQWLQEHLTREWVELLAGVPFLVSLALFQYSVIFACLSTCTCTLSSINANSEEWEENAPTDTHRSFFWCGWKIHTCTQLDDLAQFSNSSNPSPSQWAYPLTLNHYELIHVNMQHHFWTVLTYIMHTLNITFSRNCL